MMRSLYSGITGLRNHQTRMDIIGNNISNVNTAGYKSSRVIFQDIYSQTLTPASGANGTTNGGTNPMQIGLGTSLATIDVMHTRAAAQYTSRPMDLSIEGDGYFAVSSGGKISFTRAGNFYTDSANNLVTSSGAFVQCFMYVTSGSPPVTTLDTTTTSSIQIDPTLYTDVTIGEDGVISALDSTNNRVNLGVIAIATFSNENGLEKDGSNTYRSTVNSGTATYKQPGTPGAGSLNPGTLEMSNVDLAQEFSDMIVTQRGFQANSRIITTTDQMLEELVNIKR